MNNLFKKKVASVLLFFIVMCIHCGSAPNDALSGGSGAGNPGGLTTVAIVIDSISTLGKTLVGPQTQSGPSDSANYRFQISDASGMPMLVTSTAIVVHTINFTLDSTEDPALLLQQFNSQLQPDSADIALTGPFTFDATNGRSNPSIDTLRLPEARYTGVKLILDTKDIGQPGGPQSLFQIGGTFYYQGETRTFIIRLKMGRILSFPYSGPGIVVIHNDTTHLTISFNTQEWLNNVNIKTFLDNGQIALEPDGSLLIDGNGGGGGPGQSIEGNIRNNVISSGRLEVKQ